MKTEEIIASIIVAVVFYLVVKNANAANGILSGLASGYGKSFNAIAGN